MPFLTTNWTLIVQAASDDSSAARSALAGLYEAYRHPVHAFILRQGYAEADAQDLTQGYFTRFIEKEYVKDVNPGAGRFRNFVLASLRHYLSNERDHDRAQKRGGGRPLVSLDQGSAGERCAPEAVDRATPEHIFERAWANTVVDRGLSRLADMAARAEGRERFEQVKAHLSDADEPSTYRELAAAWGVGESAVRVYVYRLRRRLRRLLREEVAMTVANPAEVDDELRKLLEILSRKE